VPKVTFINPDDSSVEVDVPVGTSLMRAATNNSISGIVGDCGGGLTCASCHVYVEPDYLPVMPPMTEAEDEVLNYVAAGRQPNSRFSCQLVMTEAMDGLVVRCADPQM